MASGHPLILRQQHFAAKVETVAGTAVSLAAADGAMTSYNPDVRYDIPIVKRPSLGSLSQNPGVPGQRKALVSVTSEVANSGTGTAPLWASTLLAASGFANTLGTFAPVSGGASADTLTCGRYVDGRLKQAAGVMFSWVMRFRAGEPVLCDFSGEGVYVAPSATALITPTLPTVIPPRFAGATFTIGGASYKISELEIECNNTLYVREDATNAAGLLACCITDREFLVRCSPEATTAKDFNADHIAGTEAALSIVLGSGVNGIVTIAAPKLQLQDAPGDGDRSGVLVDELVFQANKSASAGDDELTIAFS